MNDLPSGLKKMIAAQERALQAMDDLRTAVEAILSDHALTMLRMAEPLETLAFGPETPSGQGRLFMPKPASSGSVRTGDFVRLADPKNEHETMPGIVSDFDVLKGEVLVEWAGSTDSDEYVCSWVSSKALIVITPGAILITSALVLTIGDHDHVKLWSRSGLSGELVLTAGDGIHLCQLLKLREVQPSRESE